MKRFRAAAVVTGVLVAVLGGLFITAGTASATSCGVSGGVLWCNNAAGAPLRDKPSIDEPPSQVVNHLRTTYSWFTCWSAGQYNDGGTDTWYFTEGDDNANWGWVAANYLYTTYDFDLNPSAYGLPRCQYNFG